MKKRYLKTFFAFVFLFIFFFTGCEKQQYAISYETNGGSIIADMYINKDKTILEPVIPLREGYTFGGWYSDETLLNEYSYSNIPTEDLTLYAKWIINQYKVTYFDVLVTKIVSISFGGHHSVVQTNDGRIYTMGCNSLGQLGDGTTIGKNTPIEITSQFNLTDGENIKEIEAGFFHTVAITNESRIFTWGNNDIGQLGDGTSDFYKTTPTDITSQFNLNQGESIISIAAGNEYTVAITNNSRIFTWGNNYFGQLGDGTTDFYKKKPIDITSLFNLNQDESIINIEVGDFQTVAQTSEGRIFTWGDDGFGLKDETIASKNTPIDLTSSFNLNESESIISIDVGNFYVAAITSQNRIFTWGNNSNGQLGDGTTLDKKTPIEITSSFNLNESESIIGIDVGCYHTVVLTNEGRIYTWGSNYYGQLGDKTTIDKLTPNEITSQINLNMGESVISIAASYNQTTVITSEGRLFTWGYNNDGQLGNSTTASKSTPIDILENFPIILVKECVQNYEYNSSLDSMIIFDKEGYTFDGWYIDEYLTTPFTEVSMPAKDIILYAKWTRDKEIYTTL